MKTVVKGAYKIDFLNFYRNHAIHLIFIFLTIIYTAIQTTTSISVILFTLIALIIYLDVLIILIKTAYKLGKEAIRYE